MIYFLDNGFWIANVWKELYLSLGGL